MSHLVEVPAVNENLCSDSLKDSVHESSPMHSALPPESNSELMTYKSEPSSSYDFNYISIQAGYTPSKKYSSMKFDRNSSSHYSDRSLPAKLFSHTEQTIEEQKLEESVNEVPEEDVKEIQKLPIFKEIQVEPLEAESQVNKISRIKEESDYHSSKEAIQDLNNMFPNNSYQ